MLGGVQFFAGAGAAVGALLTAFLAYGYDTLIDDPAVRRAALVGYVHQSQLDAANAKLAETNRQKSEADAALLTLHRKLQALDQRAELDAARMEQEIADYEKRLADAARGCVLSRDDVDWLRKP